jgi:thiol-disulfide isomerase/thioredoxin
MLVARARTDLRAALLVGFCAVLVLPAAPPPAAGAERKLPAFDLKLLDGTVVRSRDLAGRVVVIDFWATWCEPCLAEVPDYNRLHREYRGRLELLAVASESGGEREVRIAAKELGIRYPVAVPTPEQLALLGDVEVLPTTWVFDPSGTLVREFKGSYPGKQAALKALVEQLSRK